MRRTIACWLLLASAAFAQAPSAVVVGPAKPVPEGGAVVLDASKSSSPFDLTWTVVPETPILAVDKPPQRFAFLPAPAPGEYLVTVQALGLSEDGKRPLGSTATIRVVVGSTPAPPPAPTPPPDETKPPTPTPPPAPSAVGNMRVVILMESSANMTAAQRAVIYSTTAVLPYLNAKTIKDTDGRPSWRVWDKDTPVDLESAEWRDAMAKSKADPVALPKVVVFAGNTLVGSRGLVSEADTLSYLQSIGGK